MSDFRGSAHTDESLINFNRPTIGTITAPVGIVLFVTSKIADVSFERLTIATLPFLVPLFIVLILITLAPQLTTWLPGLFF